MSGSQCASLASFLQPSASTECCNRGTYMIAETEDLGKPEWLECLIEQHFFTPCRTHSMDKENLMKLFCVDCQTANCSKCVEDLGHTNHRLINIYTHLYQHVVKAETMGTYMNIGDIRIYSGNGKPAFFLRLRPFKKMNNDLPESSTKKGKGRKRSVYCQVCGRGLDADASVLYCCIQCKVVANVSKTDASASSPFTNPKTDEQLHEVQEVVDTETDSNNAGEPDHDQCSKQRRHRRKGIPCRAAWP
ncbi:hypothetical protein QQ045_013938 [Rhodiola kirilowii]